MNRYLFSLFALFALFGLNGCAVGTADSNVTSLVQISDMQTGAFATRPSLAEVNGELAVLYSTKDDRVALQIGSQPKQVIDATARVKKGGGFFKLWPQGSNLYAAWWSHQEGKNVYFTSSTDGGKNFSPVSMVNDVDGVLPPFTLTRGTQGTLGMTYHDERLPGYQVFFNRSADNGLSWPKPDRRLDTPAAAGRSNDAHEPQTVEAGTTWVSVWTDSIQSTGGASYRIVSRRSDDEGASWSQPVVLFSTDHHISALTMRAKGNSLVIAADELNKGIFALISQDSGQSWQSTGVLAGTSGLSNSGIKMELSNGRAQLVWMEQRKEEKVHITTGTLDILKLTWLGGAKRLDPKAYENTKSTSPVIMGTEKGALVTAWVDYRDIRPNIYLATSYDQGASWSEPQALLNPGSVSAGWPQLVRVQDKIVIAYELYPNEKVGEGNFQTRVLPVDDGAAAIANMSKYPTLGEAERSAKLKQRVDALWAHRVAGNYDQAYDMFDFAYKAATPRKLYLDNVGVITYMAYSVDEIKITGNEANVNMKIKYEVKPTILPSTGKPISVPAVDVESPTRWVWVGNDWYLVYTPSFDPPMLKY